MQRLELLLNFKWKWALFSYKVYSNENVQQLVDCKVVPGHEKVKNYHNRILFNALSF